MLMTNLLDNIFDIPYFTGYAYPQTRSSMKTDIRDDEKSYTLTMDLPGYAKEDIKAQLKNGYLTVTAEKNTDKDEKSEDGRYIRRERSIGSCSRSFYVGSELTENDINARFENGVLTLNVPKPEALPASENNHKIAIEG